MPASHNLQKNQLWGCYTRLLNRSSTYKYSSIWFGDAGEIDGEGKECTEVNWYSLNLMTIMKLLLDPTWKRPPNSPPLVVFGHMHKELAHGNGHTKMIVVGEDNTTYLWWASTCPYLIIIIIIIILYHHVSKFYFCKFSFKWFSKFRFFK